MSVPDNHTAEVLELFGDIDLALHFHLTSRVFPSQDFMFDTAKKAINAVNKGKPTQFVRLPDGVEHRRYGKTVPARAIVSGLNLGCFVNGNGE